MTKFLNCVTGLEPSFGDSSTAAAAIQSFALPISVSPSVAIFHHLYDLCSLSASIFALRQLGGDGTIVASVPCSSSASTTVFAIT
jgi:hypothetical protein